MVLLAAAAITAGGVAAYKGTKAAAEATTKSVKKKLKLSNQAKERNDINASRKAERKERFSKINEYRSSLKDVNGKKSREGTVVPSFNWKPDGSKSKSTSRTSATGNYSTRSPSSGNWWERK